LSIQNIHSLLISSKLRIVCWSEKLTELDTKQGNPFIIARANDLLTKNVHSAGNAQVTPDNPYALTLTLDMFTDLTKEFEALGCDIL
jgi:hypothetical protein